MKTQLLVFYQLADHASFYKVV